ncbi:MAG: hypothetical protein QXZ09_07455 [Candidatus Methanomethylicaceae archaeon]
MKGYLLYCHTSIGEGIVEGYQRSVRQRYGRHPWPGRLACGAGPSSIRLRPTRFRAITAPGSSLILAAANGACPGDSSPLGGLGSPRSAGIDVRHRPTPTLWRHSIVLVAACQRAGRGQREVLLEHLVIL